MQKAVERVGKQIVKLNNELDPHSKFQWQFNVIDNPREFNAFCLPGGKIFIYSGLFKVCKLITIDSRVLSIV